MNPLDLPVYRQKERILEALADHQVIVVESPTGSGKTTQIPQILYAAGYAGSLTIGVTQPRRIAAVSVSQFIAAQMGKIIPDTVGYKMRFEDRTDATTRLKIMTDGILLQELKGDPYLSRYGVIMVDEAHERSLNIDFILGLLKKILELRPQFKVIVSSATINAEVFSEYFEECPIVKIEAQSFPVDILYEPPQPEGGLEALQGKIRDIVMRATKSPEAGDILIFLPGEESIKECIRSLQLLPLHKSLEILPLYSHLSSEEQEKVFFSYPGKIKVIVATNIAETSITIDGVTCVIDSGLAKLNYYNSRNFTSALNEAPISKASSNQRKGRAGRTRPGVCYRLYSRKDYEQRPLFTLEEIYRTDLSEVVLRMAELGIKDFEDFDFLSPPVREGIISAMETLELLEALGEDRELTPIGRSMVPYPIPPRLSRMVVEAIQYYPQVLEEVLIAASFLSSRSPFLLPAGEELEARQAHHRFRDPWGDFVSWLKLFHGYERAGDKERFCAQAYLDPKTMREIHSIKLQLEEIVQESSLTPGRGGEVADYLCAVARGLIQFVCVRSGRGIYRSLTAGKIQIHPGSVLFRENPQYLVAGEIMRTSRMYARSASPLKREWLQRISPILYRNLVERGGKPEKEEKKRDFTNAVKIGSETFQIVREKGKRKIALLPWEQVGPLMARVDPAQLPDYKNLKGKVLYQGYELMSGEQLNAILAIIPRIDPQRDWLEALPGSSFSIRGRREDLVRQIGNVLKVCPLKKKSKKLGFSALYTDGGGNYWLRGLKSFAKALTESLASLESLADEAEGRLGAAELAAVNAAYRELSALLEKEQT